jgi:hypothetical protein
MANFIKVADEQGCDFLDLDKVTKVSCSVKRGTKGGGLNVRSVGNPDIPKSSPVVETVFAVIKLTTPGGSGEMHFADLAEAAQWAKANLGIEVPFDQL